MWKLCPKSGSHTHTHVTSSTTKNNSILIQSQSISIQFNLSQIIIQKTFSNHLQPQGIIPSFNDSQGLHETESPNCRYPCSDCYTSHTNQLHALDFVCCHGKIHVFLLSSIYIYKCSSKSYPKTSNEIIKVYHKSNLIAFSVNGILPKYIINYQSQACMWANVPLH